MPASDRRFWWCIKGHIMGEVRRVSVDDGRYKVTALMLYERAVLSVDVPEGLPTLRGRVIGEMLDIQCNYPGCTCTRDWHPGEDSMRRLLESVRRLHEN